jgi:hypothetical protein
MSIRIPEPKKNGDKLLVWWLRSSTWDRRCALSYLLLFAIIWLTGAYFAPRDVVEIGRLSGWGQMLAALSMGGMALVWNQLVVQGYIVDNAQAPSSLWWLLVWIGPAGVVYFIWLLHQEVWPWERPLAWIRKKWEKRPKWLRRRRKERFKDGVEVWSDWERSMALKALGRKRPVDDEHWIFPGKPKPTPPVQTAVRNGLPPSSQSSRPPAKPTAGVETPAEAASRNEKPVPQPAERPPVQLALPMGEGKEKPGEVKEEGRERPEMKRERKRRPGRPGAGRRRRRR